MSTLTMGAALPAIWFSVVLVAGARRTSSARSVRADGWPPDAARKGPRGRHRLARVRATRALGSPVTTRIGRALRQRARRPPDDERARTAGQAVLIALGASVAAGVPLGLLLAASRVVLAEAVRVRRRRRAARSAADALPDVVDLMIVAISSGHNVLLGVRAVAERAAPPYGHALTGVLTDVDRGRRLADALDDLPQVCGEHVRPLVRALTSCERYGAPLGTTLDRLADEMRQLRRRRAEERARRVPVKLLFPLVVCSMPALGLLTVVPLVVSGLQSLRS